MRKYIDRFLFWATGSYLFFIVGIWFFIWRWGDLTAGGVLLLFGPRWIWGIPLLFLVPLSLLFSRRLLWPLLVGSIVFFFPIMGFSLPLDFYLTRKTSPSDIRVFSYNIGGMKKGDYPAVGMLIQRERPDVVLFQECRIAKTDTEHFVRADWNSDIDYGSCLLSRFPILKKEVRDPENIWKLAGSGIIVRYHIDTKEGPVYLVNLHLETPREGISAVIDEWMGIARSIRHLHFGETLRLFSERRWWNPPEMEDKIFIRQFESKVAREWVDQTPHPVIVAGDFNMPTDSNIYRKYWSRFTNAYSKAGSGFESTKKTRWFGIRIDHILVGPGWEVLRSWVAPRVEGTDHAPILADLKWSTTD